MGICRALVFGVALAFAISACSSFKTRKDVAEDAKVKAVEDGEDVGPIDDEAINDGLAEMGVDPHEKPASTETPEPEISGEVTNADPVPVQAPPGKAKPAAKAKPTAKSKKKVVKKTTTKTSTKKVVKKKTTPSTDE